MEKSLIKEEILKKKAENSISEFVSCCYGLKGFFF
jgi:hypothetical protein